jgi:endonuclease YncB( thermonuclease family)
LISSRASVACAYAEFSEPSTREQKILADAETIRFDGIAAPEWDTPAGEAATKALREMVLGKLVSCELTGKADIPAPASCE